jgi:uncharacterized small protein (DUF1192 family)
MDLDDIAPHPRPAQGIVVGESLETLSVAELDARIAALKAELARVEREREVKKARAAAADALFKR